MPNRLERKLDFYQPKEQVGFIKTLALPAPIQKKANRKNHRIPLVLTNFDFRKASDTIEINSVRNESAGGKSYRLLVL